MILVSLAAAATAAPQIVPYEHVEIEAEPYIHQEIEAEPYIHIEPELTPEALGVIVRNNQPAAAAPVQFAAPAVQQQFVPAQVAPQQQFFAPQQQFAQQQFFPQQFAAQQFAPQQF